MVHVHILDMLLSSKDISCTGLLLGVFFDRVRARVRLNTRFSALCQHSREEMQVFSKYFITT